MRAQLTALAAGALLILVAAPAASAAREGRAAAAAHAWPRGEATIGYANERALHAALRRVPARILQTIPELGVARVRPGIDPDRFARAVVHLPGIRFVERLARRQPAVEPALLPSAGRAVPWEWQYAATRADAVPDWVLRAAASLTIAVVDTGADLTAPDLAAKHPRAHNTRTGTGDVRDGFGHGTFVSALAAGSVTNNDGVAGFGGDARLLVVKAGAGDGTFTDLDEAAAIVHAVERGARVINLSLGGPATSAAERRAIDFAVDHGALVVAAVGNEYFLGNPVEYPAALLQPVGSRGAGGRGLSVGASTMSGARASFSNTGSHLSLAAPGEDVFSALAAASSPSRFPRVALPGASAGLYGFASGTSFAAPEVAGAAALVWAANPLLDASAVADILEQTASGRGAWNAELGFGVLDVGAAVARATGTQAAAAGATIALSGRIENRVALLRGTLRTAAPGATAAGRTIVLEAFDGSGWTTWRRASTSAAGAVAFRVALRPGPYRVRARWGGASDLAGAVSETVALRVRR